MHREHSPVKIRAYVLESCWIALYAGVFQYLGKNNARLQSCHEKQLCYQLDRVWRGIKLSTLFWVIQWTVVEVEWNCGCKLLVKSNHTFLSAVVFFYITVLAVHIELRVLRETRKRKSWDHKNYIWYLCEKTLYHMRRTIQGKDRKVGMHGWVIRSLNWSKSTTF